MSTVSIPTAFAEQVVSAIRTTVGVKPVVLHEPSFSGNEWLYLKECLDSTFVSSVGQFVDRFEADIATFTGARHAVAVVMTRNRPIHTSAQNTERSLPG